MSLILNIDTAVDTASVCLAKDGEVLQFAANETQKDHAAWLHTAIADILQKNGSLLNDLNAVAVSIGPGSYTGLRVGLSSAKGLCYALNIPLVSIGTLEMIAFAAREEDADLICPMIDARRMEVFTAVYDKILQQVMAPHAIVVDENSFASLLLSSKIIFCGNGCKKLQTIILNKNAFFSLIQGDATQLASLSYKHFLEHEFADLAYTEPLYIKEFYSPARKPLA
jgi:tRNA threonylcarbamoyladenosine biosynthesis protein TsaB